MDGIPNGKGVEYTENGIKVYEGEWRDGKSEGKGIGYDKNGNENLAPNPHIKILHDYQNKYLMAYPI